MPRVIKTDQGRAVTHAPAQADLSGSTQGRFKRQGTEPVSVRCQAFGVPAIAAEEQTAQFTRGFATRKVCWGEPKIKAWTNIASLIRAPVARPIPFGIVGKLLELAI